MGVNRAVYFIFCPVMIWDDTRKKMVYEISFHSPVLSVRLKRDKYVTLFAHVVLKEQ